MSTSKNDGTFDAYLYQTLENKLLKTFPAEIKNLQGLMSGYEADTQTALSHLQSQEGFAGIEIHGRQYEEKQDAGEALLGACHLHKGMELKEIGSCRGFQMEVSLSLLSSEFTLTLKGAASHKVTLGTDPRGNLICMDNALVNIPKRMERTKKQPENLEAQQEVARTELGKPFP